MTISKTRLAVLALGLAVTALASPSYAQGAGPAISALEASGPAAVRALMAPTAAALVSVERGEVGGNGVERNGGVVAAGGHP